MSPLAASPARAPLAAPARAPLAARPPRRRAPSRRPLRALAASDDEEIPVVSGHFKRGFTDAELQALARPKLLGGATIGEELALIHERMAASEAAFAARGTELSRGAWRGDVYVGGRWNELSLLYAAFLAAPACVGLFAWLSYGKLWATGRYF
jgi:hypothetical protein